MRDLIFTFTAVLTLNLLLTGCHGQGNSTESGRNCVASPTGSLALSVDVLGVPGPQGSRGEKGMRGSIGPVGPQGIKGDVGEKGAPGDRGAVGPPGSKGVKGDMGMVGEKGIKGAKGSVGDPGLAGPPGGRGPPGVEGPEGPLGPDGSQGPRGTRGPQGNEGSPGPPGPQGSPGLPGSVGEKGEPGDTILNDEEFVSVCSNVSSKVSTTLSVVVRSEVNTTKNDIEKLMSLVEVLNVTLEEERRKVAYLNEILNNPFNHNCRGGTRVALIDMTQPSSRCPSTLTEVSNSATGQRACGRTVDKGCSSVVFPVGEQYSQVCGRVRGYQFGELEIAWTSNISNAYMGGVSITHGSPRQHLWTYAVGRSEHTNNGYYGCPCAKGDASLVPSFVGEHYYCESGFIVRSENRTAWEDPLWDGKGCVSPGNTCCDRFGWFNRAVTPTTDDIEVRWCANFYRNNEDVFTDIVEIWVK